MALSLLGRAQKSPALTVTENEADLGMPSSGQSYYNPAGCARSTAFSPNKATKINWGKPLVQQRKGLAYAWK